MLSVSGKNSVKKNEIIFMQGEQVKQVGIVLSGKVLMENEWFKLVRPQGSFLALNDLNQEEYSGTYTAMEDSVVYALPVIGQETLRDIINKNADYRAIMIASQYKYVTAIARIRQDLYDRVSRLYTFAKRSYENYESACLNAGMSVIEFDELRELPMYEKIEAVGEDKLGYYAAAAKIPLGANKLYFSYSEEMVDYQVMEVLELVDTFKEDIVAMVEYLKDLLSLIAHRDNHNLLEYACVQGQEMRKGGNVSEDMQELLSDIVNEVDFQYTALKKQIKNVAQIDIDAMRARVSDVITKEMTETEKKSKEEKEATIKRDVLSLKGSMEQVIKYGGLDEETAEKLRTNVEHLVKAPDRLSVEDDVKKAKKTITPIVFELYLACFRKMYSENRGIPKAVELFLNFGMLDERLLEQEQLEFLCGIDIAEDDGPCHVFTMVEWLTAIQEGRREASKSEFDEDYIENLRTLKKQGEITEEQMKKLANDMDRRVEYEVRNMMMSNMRVAYGQPTAYMPILYKEAIYGYLDKILVTKKAINESVIRLMKIDYSAFYREVIYSNNDLKIINETTMKNVYPDIILFPLFGINASMWQEVGGKSKSTPGRFAFPMLTNTNIDDMMVKMFGRFRWELCRNIQGMQWNDIKVKSLTSEYMDYIQFYRKNRELSEEWREKVKLQIQKGRNNSREIFLMDYEAWVKNESNGSMKLNKVSRELLATYCPFEKSLRTKLNGQRAYELAQARHGRNCQKKTQEFELKIKAMQKETDNIPKEIMDTYEFFSSM
ncbi:MAG: cyclic nucleotide-binding domain-containing protein [Lachnospiraceae bacterium]|nr:cyclic nucleotide-binding domain-containing protein [Lachnospiraceae bacterium]